IIGTERFDVQLAVQYTITSRQIIRARIIGEEELRRVETSCRRKCPADGRTAIVGKLRLVSGVASDAEMPAGLPRDSGQNQRTLEIGQGTRFLTTGEGQNTIGNLPTDRETTRSPPQDGFVEGKFRQFLKRTAIFVGQFHGSKFVSICSNSKSLRYIWRNKVSLYTMIQIRLPYCLINLNRIQTSSALRCNMLSHFRVSILKIQLRVYHGRSLGTSKSSL